MKKLTAGIFATILGLTTVNAFAAAAGTKVASTGYVQGAINSLATVAKTGAYDDLTGKPTIPSIAGLATSEEVAQALADAKAYADENDANTVYDDTALAGRVTTAEGKITAAEGKITTIEGQQTTQDQKIEALEKAGYITTAALSDYATKTYAENEADAAQAAAIAAAANDATTKANQALEAAKAYADENDADTVYDDTALKGRVAANEAAIDQLEEGHQGLASNIGVNAAHIKTIQDEQTTQNTNIKALQDATVNYVTWGDVEDTYSAQ